MHALSRLKIDSGNNLNASGRKEKMRNGRAFTSRIDCGKV
jgi:hypothetical protein